VGYLSTVRRKLGTVGIRGTIALAARRAYDTILHGRLLVFRADLPTYVADEALVDKGTCVVVRNAIAEVTLIERRVFEEYGGYGLIRLWEKRFSLGHRLFVTYYSDKVAGASWVYEGKANGFFTVPLGVGDAFVVAVFILDSFRGKGLGMQSLALMLSTMREEGFKRAFICTKEWNFFRKSIRRAGFEFVGKVREIRLLGRAIQVWSDIEGEEFQ
jgi:GNAT superfamily N-acetyltransferase